jgi:hemolysin D
MIFLHLDKTFNYNNWSILLISTAPVYCSATQMQIDDRLVSLSPSMAAVEIKTSTRLVIDYLLSPLARAKHQALRER